MMVKVNLPGAHTFFFQDMLLHLIMSSSRTGSGEGLQSHRSAERARQRTKCDVLWGNGKSHILHSSGKVVYEMRSAHHIHVTYYTCIIVLDTYLYTRNTHFAGIPSC